MATNNILLLPIDILINIFKRLKISDVKNLMVTCKTFRDYIKNDNMLWKVLSRDRLILNHSSGAKKSASKDLSWYNRCRISHNWCSGYYRSKVVLHHYTNYMPWINFYKSEYLLVSVGSELHCYPTNKKGLLNNQVALWKVEVPKVRRHDVRTNDISRFIIKNNILLCGNRDGCVSVYSINNIHKKPRLQCHIKDCHDNGLAEVTAVELSESRNNLLITGSNDSLDVLLCNTQIDNNCMGFDLSQNHVINIPTTEGAGTKCMALNMNSDKLALGLNGNSKPILLDVNTAQFLLTSPETKNHKQAVRDLQWHNENTISYVTHSGYLQMVDIRTQTLVYSTRDPFQSTLYCVKSDGENAIIVGSAEYSRCVLFDARQCSCHVQMYFTQKKTSPVYCLDFDSTKLLSAVDRGVAVLNFNIDPAMEIQRDYSHVFN